MSQALKNITARLALTAAYEGTKVGDLMKYLKGLAPGIRFMPADAPMRGSHDPGVKHGNMTPQQAMDLGNKLIADGWYGRKVTEKGKNARGEPYSIQYVLYVPSSENGVEYKSEGMPNIKVFKPEEGARSIRFRVGQATRASNRERQYLAKLNRLANQSIAAPKIDRGYWSGGGGAGAGPRGREYDGGRDRGSKFR